MIFNNWSADKFKEMTDTWLSKEIEGTDFIVAWTKAA